VCLRLRFLDPPLNRDEGEYAYVAQLMLRGILPYAEAYIHRWPGIYVAHALIEPPLGQTATAVRFGLIVVHATAVITVMRSAVCAGSAHRPNLVAKRGGETLNIRSKIAEGYGSRAWAIHSC
jgi:hypothetical protein